MAELWQKIVVGVVGFGIVGTLLAKSKQIVGNPVRRNPRRSLARVHPEAIESLKRYKDDLKAGHTAAAEYWRGQAGAYFTANPIFDASTDVLRSDIVNYVRSSIHAPYVSVQVSTLGGVSRASIIVHVSLDPRESWLYGIFQNSRYFILSIDTSGVIEQFSMHGLPKKLRKTRAGNIREAVDKINRYIEGLGVSNPRKRRLIDDIGDELYWYGGFPMRYKDIAAYLGRVARSTGEKDWLRIRDAGLMGLSMSKRMHGGPPPGTVPVSLQDLETIMSRKPGEKIPQDVMDRIWSRNPVSRMPSTGGNLYESFHGQPSAGQRQVYFDLPGGQPLIKLGRLRRIDYQVEGSSRHKGTVFFHNAGDLGEGKKVKSNAILASNQSGTQLYIVKEDPNSEYPKMSERGILG